MHSILRSSFGRILLTTHLLSDQPFDCLIVQNHQAVQSMRRSMDWTLEDNMVDGLFFCITLTGRRRPYPICTSA